MKHPIRYIIILLTTLFAASTTYAQTAHAESADSIHLSLLTCAPGQEIYAAFGHTAIRYEDTAKGVDLVFNYGIFSFGTPNFIWRFVKGETDYQLGVYEYERFAEEYAYYNRAVWQQELNLTPEEKQELINLLIVNYRPENRVYRYNFFFDNCATRPRDKIEESIDGKVSYKETDNRQTFRDIVHESTRYQAWDRFGMDFCLGIKADRLMSYREEMFSPIYLMEAFKGGVITSKDGKQRPLVSGQIKKLVPAKGEKPSPTPFTPMRLFLLLFIVTAGITIYGLRKRKSLWGVDLVLFAAAGLAGCVVAFLSCFSEHPAVSPNYLIFAFHPLHLLLLPFVLFKEAKGKKSWYHRVNFVVLTLFIILWPVIPQYFDPAVLPLALCLLIRSLSNILITHK